MNDQLIDALGTATRIACATVAKPGHRALQASLDLACAVPAGSGWEPRAAAHAGFFSGTPNAPPSPTAPVSAQLQPLQATKPQLGASQNL